MRHNRAATQHKIEQGNASLAEKLARGAKFVRAQIIGKKIESENALDFSSAEPSANPRLLFASRSRSRSPESSTTRISQSKLQKCSMTNKRSSGKLLREACMLLKLQSFSRKAADAGKTIGQTQKKKESIMKVYNKKIPKKPAALSRVLSKPEFSISSFNSPSQIVNKPAKIQKKIPRKQSIYSPTKQDNKFEMALGSQHGENLTSRESRQRLKENKAPRIPQEKRRGAQRNIYRHKSQEDLRSKLQPGTNSKEHITETTMRSPRNQEERISSLGLELVYKLNRKAHKTMSQEINLTQPNRNEKTQNQKECIKKYIDSKKAERTRTKKLMAEKQQQEQERISQNILKLNNFVKGVLSPKINVIKFSSKRRSPLKIFSKNHKKNNEQKFEKIMKGLEKEKKRVTKLKKQKNVMKMNDDQIMERLKSQLQKEIRVPISGIVKKKKLQPSQSQPQLEDLTEHITRLKDRYQEIQEKELQMYNSAVLIQAVVRGYLARKRILQMHPHNQEFLFNDFNLLDQDLGQGEILDFGEIDPKSDTEKVVHLSRLENSNEDDIPKNEPKKLKEIGVVTEPQFLESTPQTLSVESNTEVEKSFILASPSPANDNSAIFIVEKEEELFCPEREPRGKLSEYLQKNPKIQKPQYNMFLDSSKEESKSRSIFDREPFEDFKIKRFGETLNHRSVTRFVSLREEAIAFREKTEKKYIKRMFKSKQLSPTTYHRKRRELEKWVTKEKEESNKVKTKMMDSWKKTTDIIEETHKNILLTKKCFHQALSYLSDTNSSIGLDNSKPVTCELDANDLTGLDALDNKSHNLLWKRKNPLERLSKALHTEEVKKVVTQKYTEHKHEEKKQADVLKKPLRKKAPEIIPIPQPEEAKIPEFDSNKGALELVSVSEEVDESLDSKLRSPIDTPQNEEKKAEKLPQKIQEEEKNSSITFTIYQSPKESPLCVTIESKTREEIGQELTSLIFTEVMGKEFSNLYPLREPVPIVREEDSKSLDPSNAHLLQALSTKNTGIRTDLYTINDYLDELFAEVLNSQKREFLDGINRAIVKSPIEILEKLQSPDPEQRMQLSVHIMTTVVIGSQLLHLIFIILISNNIFLFKWELFIIYILIYCRVIKFIIF